MAKTPSMKKDTPTREEWQALYQAAMDYKEGAPWGWMYNNDLFGVEDPETGAMTVSCIMGELGEHLALGSYTFPEGFKGLMRMMDDTSYPDHEEMPFVQDCLMCSFEDRDLLTNADRQVIKDLGLRFRGRNAWPLFRRYRPGFVPWPLTASECRLLTVTLEQSLHVALRCRESKRLLQTGHRHTLFARVIRGGGGAVTWEDGTMDARIPQKKYPVGRVDALQVKRCNAVKQHPQVQLELDCFYIPTAISDQEPHYFPLLAVLVDHREGLVLAAEPIEDPTQPADHLVRTLCQFIERYKVRPAKVLSCRNEVYAAISDVARRLKFEVEFVDSLPAVAEFRGEFLRDLPQF